MRLRILWRYVALEYLKAFAGTLAGLCLIYLVVDYVDRAKYYVGPAWLRWVLELYACKAVLVAYELAPGAMLIAAGVTMAGLRRRGEYIALRSLALGPAHLLGPVAAVALLLGGAVMVGDEVGVGPASRRVDQINVERFHYWGSFRLFFGEVRWFRGRRHIYHLRQGSVAEGFSGVTLLTLSDDFRLAQRIDAERLEPVGGSVWKLRRGTARTLAGSTTQVERFEERDIVLDEDPTAFRIIKGRPEQLALHDLREQIDLRRNVGLPAERWVLTLYNKLAYPLGGLPGVLLACALTLRPGRRSFLTSALAEGFVIIIGYWALLVVFKAAALAGMVSPALAAWGPMALVAGAAVAALRRFAR
ncbi:MAG: LptF/LptG family permease [Deltaproteobacteria bacterium]|nr:LptF/LptG family permease [Deltaproteobacteria bacterium]